MKKLLFEIEEGKIIWFSTNEYKVVNHFYEFIDKFGLPQKFHEGLFRGVQEVGE